VRVKHHEQDKRGGGHGDIVGQSGTRKQAPVPGDGHHVGNGHAKSHGHHHFDYGNRDDEFHQAVERHPLSPDRFACRIWNRQKGYAPVVISMSNRRASHQGLFFVFPF